MKRSIFLIFLFVLGTLQTFAQNTVAMADEMRNSGKIYVVVAVIALILISLLVYLFSIDRRLKKIENRE